MSKDLLIRTALDVRKIGASHSGSPRMCPINPQQAAEGVQIELGGIKAALALVGTFDIYDDGFFNSVGVSNHDFAAAVSYNIANYFTWADAGASDPTFTILKDGLCWVHMHAEGVMVGDGTNQKYMAITIQQDRGGVIDQIHAGSHSLADTLAGVCNDVSVLFAVEVGDTISAIMAGGYPAISNTSIDVRFDVMQIY